jgi:hypothetical protein
MINKQGWAEELSDQSSIYKFYTREPGKLKLLALTDLHFFGTPSKENDTQTLKDIRKMIKRFDPELMLIDGDIWHDNLYRSGLDSCEWACEQLGKMNIPWAFVWGNHDTCEDYAKCHQIIMGAANSIYRGTKYNGNYRIEICSPGQSEPFWNFIIVNNGIPGYFMNPEIKWFNEEVGRIKQEYPNPPPAFLFFHIPFKEFKTIWETGLAKGVQLDPWPNFTKDHFEGFAAIKKSGIAKAVICAHWHCNNFYGNLEGVRLEELRATGYNGYGGETVRKGGTNITIDVSRPDPQFDLFTVFADGKIMRFWEASK